MCGCDDLIFDFEKSRLDKFFGVKIVPNGLEYAITTKDRYFDLIPATKTLKLWPNKLIDFLESRIVFEMPNETPNAPQEIQLSRNVDVVGLPDEIIGNYFLFNFFVIVFI